MRGNDKALKLPQQMPLESLPQLSFGYNTNTKSLTLSSVDGSFPAENTKKLLRLVIIHQNQMSVLRKPPLHLLKQAETAMFLAMPRMCQLHPRSFQLNTLQLFIDCRRGSSSTSLPPHKHKLTGPKRRATAKFALDVF